MTDSGTCSLGTRGKAKMCHCSKWKSIAADLLTYTWGGSPYNQACARLSLLLACARRASRCKQAGAFLWDMMGQFCLTCFPHTSWPWFDSHTRIRFGEKVHWHVHRKESVYHWRPRLLQLCLLSKIYMTKLLGSIFKAAANSTALSKVRTKSNERHNPILSKIRSKVRLCCCKGQYGYSMHYYHWSHSLACLNIKCKTLQRDVGNSPKVSYRT